jgi:hypothetical protein
VHVYVYAHTHISVYPRFQEPPSVATLLNPKAARGSPGCHGQQTIALTEERVLRTGVAFPPFCDFSHTWRLSELLRPSMRTQSYPPGFTGGTAYICARGCPRSACYLGWSQEPDASVISDPKGWDSRLFHRPAVSAGMVDTTVCEHQGLAALRLSSKER